MLKKIETRKRSGKSFKKVELVILSTFQRIKILCQLNLISWVRFSED